MKNFVRHGSISASEGGLTRRAKQAQDCIIADRESASRADAINGSEGMADRNHFPPDRRTDLVPVARPPHSIHQIACSMLDQFAAGLASTRR
ncbi:MAG TPA: hypothetical protein VF901_10335 [Bradyrhizobium sp.]